MTEDGDYFEVEEVFDPDDYLYFYDDMLSEERSETETEFLEENLEIEKDDKLLDVPCGHGRISNRLAERGYEVVGMDINEEFLDIAMEDASDREISENTEYLHGDMRSIPFSDEFDAAYNVFTSFGYFSDEENQVVLNEINDSLKEGGRFVLEVANRDYIIKNFGVASVVRQGEDMLIEEREFDVLTSRNETKWTIIRDGERRETEFSTRMYTYTELESMLLDAGFEVLEVYGNMDGDEYSTDSNRICIVAENVE